MFVIVSNQVSLREKALKSHKILHWWNELNIQSHDFENLSLSLFTFPTFSYNARKNLERDFSLSQTWLYTTTKRQDQARGKENSRISLYFSESFHNIKHLQQSEPVSGKHKRRRRTATRLNAPKGYNADIMRLCSRSILDQLQKGLSTLVR